MSPSELRRRSISLDCDTIYFSDVLGEFRACPPGFGCSFYFEDEENKPIYSYLRFKPGTKTVVDVREKVAISRFANTGAYAFPCGEKLRDACGEVLDDPPGEAGEFYISNVIRSMITAGEKFVGVRVPSFRCVGTPQQLLVFLRAIKRGQIKMQRKARFCIDLGCLLLDPSSGSSSSSPGAALGCHARVEPLRRNIRLLQELKAAGHYVMVETSGERPWQEGSTDGESNSSGSGDLPLRSLRENGICYDKIVVGRPVADVYIDSRAGSEVANLAKEVGWFLDPPNDDFNQGGHVDRSKGGGGEDFITPREFNKITRLDERLIVKSAPVEYLRGEANFYRAIPPELSDLFPKLVACNDDEGALLPSITITKVSRRLRRYAPLYNGFEGVDVAAMAEVILSYLLNYQEEERFRQADFVHGDPVFSNCLLTKDNDVVFIDMRGALGDLVCTKGDVNYDLSKVFQSLWGYDFHILDRRLDQRATDVLHDLRQNVFWPYVQEHYPDSLARDIAVLAASHFLSILPLHNDLGHRARFLSACEDILVMGGLLPHSRAASAVRAGGRASPAPGGR